MSNLTTEEVLEMAQVGGVDVDDFYTWLANERQDSFDDGWNSAQDEQGY